MNSILNDEQKLAVFSPIDKHIRIVASAGSGKTTTILYRIKYLLEKGVDPSCILLTTFNVDAADVLKDRLKNKLNIDEKILKKMFIGTIDSISFRFYRMYFSQNSYRGVQEYSTELLKFLNTSDGKEKILDKFSYVFFDEFQDANHVQFEILKKFSLKSFITVIGDDAQNIYQWRGSNIDYILNFEKFFPNTLTFKLESNYRSSPEIIAFANESISNNIDQIQKVLKPTKPVTNILPLITKVYNLVQHSSYIINKIKSYIKNGIKLHEIAILSRNNYGLKKIEEELEKEKVKYISLISDNDNTKIKIIPDHICLTTIHKSKGLEWDVVFVIQCEDAKFPSEIDPISIEEERRLFYVAITRPRMHLEITFISDSLSRFVTELPVELYHFPKYDKKYMEVNNKRNIKFETAITKLIPQFDSLHIEEMRKLNILPELQDETNKVSSQLELDKFIPQYNFNQDYGIFIDRYICRKLGDKKDRDADIVINSIEVPKKDHTVYIKYKVNLTLKLNKNDKDSINKLNKIDGDIDAIIKIDGNDEVILKSIAKKILELAIKHDLETNEILVLPVSYLPEEFKTNMIESYKRFKSKDFELNDIYDVSLCASIRDERRRLLYKSIYDNFTSNQKMFKHINKWTNQFELKNIKLKLVLNDYDRFISGEIDMYDVENKTLIDFKVSSSSIKLDWIIQLLAYASIMRKKLKLTVDFIQIYNPLMGTESKFDIKDWNKENELLDYFVKVRQEKLNRNNDKVPKNKNVYNDKVINNKVIKPEVKPIINTPIKTKTLDDSFFDFNPEEIEAMKNVEKIVEKVRIKPKSKKLVC